MKLKGNMALAMKFEGVLKGLEAKAPKAMRCGSQIGMLTVVFETRRPSSKRVQRNSS